MASSPRLDDFLCEVLSSCSVPEGDYDVLASNEEVRQMNQFMNEILTKTKDTYGSYKALYHKTADERFNWRQEHLDRVPLHASAVYLFSGMDLVNLAGMQPYAQSHTLLAEFDAGDFKTFSNPACIEKAIESARRWFVHMGARDFLYSNTREMKKMFEGSCGQGKIGVLPALLLNAALLGHHVVGAVQEGSRTTLHTQVQRTNENSWRCGKLSYVGGSLVTGAESLSVDLLGASTPWFVMVKAGPHYVMRTPWFAKLITENSVALIQDESGPLPTALQENAMQVVPYGNFVDYLPNQQAQYPGDAKSIHQLYSSNAPVEALPFCFGYCYHSKEGTLMASTRKDFFIPKVDSPKVWLVLATQRSGSSWLTSLIAQHPDVHFDRKEESLIKWTERWRKKEPEGDWSEAAFRKRLDEIWKDLTSVDSRVVGFKLMEDQIPYPRIFTDFLRSKESGFVHLERRYSIMQHISSLQTAADGGKARIHDQELKPRAPDPVSLSPTKAKSVVDHTKKRHSSMKQWADTWATDGLHIFYEDLIENTKGVLNEVFTVMGIDPNATLIRNHNGIEDFFKLHDGSCADRLENPVEVLDVLKGTPSACCFSKGF